MMDEGEADQLDARACEAEYSAREAMKSLVQAAKDHAATMRRLAAVEAERDAANERLAAVEAVCAEWDARLRRDMADEEDANMVTVTYGAASRRIREALADPEGGT